MIKGINFLTEKQLIATSITWSTHSSSEVILYGAKRFFIFIVFFFSPLNLSAQNSIVIEQPVNENQAFTSAVNLYIDAIHNHTKIYTGKYHKDHYQGVNGHPFFDEILWETGSVVYDNQRYDSIEIKYDIYSDLLLIKYIDQQGYIRSIQLYREKVSAFQIKDHHFVNIREDSLLGYISGYYDLLVPGDRASVLAKRRKEVNETNTLNSLEYRFVINDILYIRIDENFYEVKNRKSMLKTLSDRKSELKSFMKLNKKRFKKDHEKKLVEVVKYYNTIVNNKET